nr:retrovirus-related Pol polyprotein from transposon TNT 1-94 [Tanacetum cinerariifolium]
MRSQLSDYGLGINKKKKYEGSGVGGAGGGSSGGGAGGGVMAARCGVDNGISNLLAVATTFTGSGNLYCQWELLTWQWEYLVHFIPNITMDSSVALTAFANADHAGFQDTRRSTSGSVQFLGERLICWSSKRQKSTAISNTEADYIALSGCCA